MEITEIRHQKLSTLLASFLECDDCKCVVGFYEAEQSGGCPICKSPNRVRTIYFRSPVHSLIDLMQESYHSKNDSERTSAQIRTDSNGSHRLAVVIFFCSLAEVLLDGFLREAMDKASIPDRLQNKLFRDNKSFPQKLDLFQSLTGAKIKNGPVDPRLRLRSA